MDFGAILIALLTAGVVKVTVMVLSVRLVLKLYRASHLREKSHKLWLLLPDESLPEIRVLWWSLVLFAVSELVCGVEVYIFFQSNQVLASIHAVTSGFGMGLFAYGMFLFADRKFIHYGGDRCLANRICQGCTIEAPPGCKFRVFILLVTTFVMIAALGAFLAPTERMYADMKNWALPFDSMNAWFDATAVPWMIANLPGYDPTGKAFYIPEAELLIEFRILPALALLLCLISVRLIQGAREHIGMKIMVFALGMLAYTYFEIFLYPATGDALIGSLGHEVVELWFLVITAEFLVLSFGAGQQGVPPEPQPSPPAEATPV